MTLRFPVPVVAATVILLAAPVSGRAQSARPGGFPDVPPGHWAADAVGKLERAGILKGYPRGTAARANDRGYQGNKPVTRYELAVTLWRFVQYVERADAQKKGTRGVRNDAPTGKQAVQRLIGGGYLPGNTPLSSSGEKLVTANQLADALSQVIARVVDRRTPITPGSEFGPPEPGASD